MLKVLTRWWSSEKYIGIDDLRSWLQSQKRNVNSPETVKFIDFLRNELEKAKIAE